MRERRACPKHPAYKLVRAENCPVQFVYLHVYLQKFHEDHKRWIGGIICTQKESLKNLHSHAIHNSNKISQSVKDQISSAVESNPSLTPSDISLGKGIGFTPSAVDASSSHLGKVARVISKAKKSSACNARDWSPTTSEKHAEEVDETDFQKSGDLANRRRSIIEWVDLT